MFHIFYSKYELIVDQSFIMLVRNTRKGIDKILKGAWARFFSANFWAKWVNPANKEYRSLCNKGNTSRNCIVSLKPLIVKKMQIPTPVCRTIKLLTT